MIHMIYSIVKLIGKFLARPKQFKSAIINMSSLTACKPSKYWQISSSTKAFKEFDILEINAKGSLESK